MNFQILLGFSWLGFNSSMNNICQLFDLKGENLLSYWMFTPKSQTFTFVRLLDIFSHTYIFFSPPFLFHLVFSLAECGWDDNIESCGWNYRWCVVAFKHKKPIVEVRRRHSRHSRLKNLNISNTCYSSSLRLWQNLHLHWLSWLECYPLTPASSARLSLLHI